MVLMTLLLTTKVLGQSDKNFTLKEFGSDINVMVNIKGSDTTYSLTFIYKVNDKPREVSHIEFIGKNSKQNILNVLEIISTMEAGENIQFSKNDSEVTDGFEVICGKHIIKHRMEVYNAIRKTNGLELYVFFEPKEIKDLINLMNF